MAFCLLLLLCLSPYAPASLALGSAGARDAEQGAAPVTVFEQTLLFPQPMALFLQWMEARFPVGMPIACSDAERKAEKECGQL